jgi:DNA-binding CsgD family transcriptional regulator
MEKPNIAIVSENTLENLGLKSILDKIVPFAQVETFFNFNDFQVAETRFFHFFVSPKILIDHPLFFLQNQKKTIVLLSTVDPRIPQDFHEILVNCSYEELLRELLQLVWHFHHNYERFPTALADELKEQEVEDVEKLTPRETEVLKAVAMGYSSKEIADRFHISLTTVLSHRKNVMEKLSLHSATKLVIYAVMHGLVNPDDIR